MNEDYFVSPTVLTVKKDKPDKIALESRKLNETAIKGKGQMPNMEELISRMSRRNLCIFTVTGGEFTGYCRFLKGFYSLVDLPTVFQERIDKTLEFKHSAWPDDIITVTKGSVE